MSGEDLTAVTALRSKSKRGSIIGDLAKFDMKTKRKAISSTGFRTVFKARSPVATGSCGGKTPQVRPSRPYEARRSLVVASSSRSSFPPSM